MLNSISAFPLLPLQRCPPPSDVQRWAVASRLSPVPPPLERQRRNTTAGRNFAPSRLNNKARNVALLCASVCSEPTAHSPQAKKLTVAQLRETSPYSNSCFQALLTSQLKLCSSWTEAQELFEAFSDEFNHVNTAAMICHLPKVVKQSDVQGWERSELEMFLFEASHCAEQLLHDCRPRELANIAYGFAKLGVYSKRLTQLLVGRAMHLTIQRFNEQELANLLWAISSVQHELPPQMLAAVHTDLLHRLASPALHPFKPQELSSIAYSLATMARSPASPALLHRLATHITPLLPSFEGQALSNTLWAFSKLNHTPDAPAMAAFLSRAHTLLPALEDQHLAQLSYSLYSLHQTPSEAWQLAFHHTVTARASTLASSPRNLCMVLLFLARLQARCKPTASLRPSRTGPLPAACSPRLHTALLHRTLPALTAATAGRLHAFDRADLATGLLCLAHCSYKPPRAWMAELVHHVRQSADKMTAQDLGNTLWALARLRCCPSRPTLKHLCRCVVERLCTMNAQNIANAVWALARLRVTPSLRWTGLLLRELVARRDDLVVLPRHVASTVWSLHLMVPRRARAAFLADYAVELQGLEALSAQLLPQCTESELYQLAAGFANIGCGVGQEWQQAYAAVAAAPGGAGVADVGDDGFDVGMAAALRAAAAAERAAAAARGGRVGAWKVQGPGLVAPAAASGRTERISLLAMC